MSTYRISRLAGGIGFKVQVADAAGGPMMLADASVSNE